jgi:hypothetical protein
MRCSILGARRTAALAALAALTASACARPASHYVIDATMTSAHRAAAPALSLSEGGEPLAFAGARSAEPPLTLLAGDMHCHVAPPDDPPHVTRGVPETVELAASEGLDFVVLTPHVGALFFQDDDHRAYVRQTLAALRRAVSTAKPTRTRFIVGMEYTDHRFGHVGLGFADLDKVLGDVPASDARARPELFFERYVAHGGVLVVNHPLVTPLESFVSIARADLSWRPFTSEEPFPAEIAAVDRLAQGFEAYNLTATHLRDRYLLGDTEHTIHATTLLLDRAIPARARRMTPVGGSDSHSAHLRATTFVWSRGRSEEAIRDAIVAGRACVRDPAACSLEARAPGRAWLTVGSAIAGVSAVEVRAKGESIDIRLDGARVAEPASGEVVRVAVSPGKCSVLRAIVDEGYSAPIYVNCPFAG